MAYKTRQLTRRRFLNELSDNAEATGSIDCSVQISNSSCCNSVSIGGRVVLKDCYRAVEIHSVS